MIFVNVRQYLQQAGTALQSLTSIKWYVNFLDGWFTRGLAPLILATEPMRKHISEIWLKHQTFKQENMIGNVGGKNVGYFSKPQYDNETR